MHHRREIVKQWPYDISTSFPGGTRVRTASGKVGIVQARRIGWLKPGASKSHTSGEPSDRDFTWIPGKFTRDRAGQYLIHFSDTSRFSYQFWHQDELVPALDRPEPLPPPGTANGTHPMVRP